MRRAFFSDQVNTVSFGFRVARGQQRCMAVADQHNEIEINFVETGELTAWHGADTSTLSEGNAILYWAAIPHQVVAVVPDTKIIWLVVPLSWFLSWNLPPQFSAPLLMGEILPLPKRIGRAEVGLLLRHWADDFASVKQEMKGILQLEVEAFFRRLALLGRFQRTREGMTAAPARKKQEVGRVEKMVRFMTEHAKEPISVSQVADAAGLNPEYAMRLFRRNWGMTLRDFLLQQRIFRAKRLLVLENSKVSDIAFECGFNSASRFYSSFAKYCGCTPLAFRRQYPEQG